MDPITQGLLGAATAQLGFRQKLGRSAGWVAAATAMLADLDIFVPTLLSWLGTDLDDLKRVAIHRGLSHSLLAVPVLALPVAWLWWRVIRRGFARRARLTARREATAEPDPVAHPEAAAIQEERKPPPDPGPPFWPFLLCTLIAAASHPLLDACTSYGTQLLAPLRSTRYALNAVPVIDLIYTAILVCTLLLCRVLRLPDPRGATRATAAVAVIGLLLSSGYIAAGRICRDRAAGIGRAIVAGRGQRSVEAYPAPGTIFVWRVVVETEEAWHVLRVRPWYEASASKVTVNTAKKFRSHFVRGARMLKPIRTFNWFAMGQTRATLARDKKHRAVVTIDDMRYGLAPDSIDGLWAMEVTFDRDGQPDRIRRIHRGRGLGLSEIAHRVWADIWAP